MAARARKGKGDSTKRPAQARKPRSTRLRQQTRSDVDLLANPASDLVNAASCAERKIEDALRGSRFRNSDDLAPNVYAIKSRIKTKYDILEKIFLKRTSEKNPDPKYDVNRITDACGFRIVTLFLSTIETAVDEVIRLVNHDTPPGTSMSPFENGDLREVIIYTSRLKKDPLSIVNPVKKIVTEGGFGDKLKVDVEESLYSSVHLIIGCRVEVPGPNKTTQSITTPVEIQVRNVFEDAWAEIEHKLVYAIQKLSAIRAPEEARKKQNYVAWEPHLLALKSLIDGCGQYADVINEQAVQTHASLDDSPTRKLPIESPVSVLDYFRSTVVLPGNILERFEQAYALRDQATAATSKRETRRLMGSTAEEFGAIENDEQDFLGSGKPGSKKLKYYLQMERAFGLQGTGDSDDLEIAVGIYEQYVDQEKNDAVPPYRLGNCQIRLMRYDEALRTFELAIHRLGLDERFANEPKHWIYGAIYRNRGLVYYHKSEKFAKSAPECEERLDLLLKAYKDTRRAYEANTPPLENKASILNNLTYYCVQFMTLGSRGVPKERLPNGHEEDLRRYLEEFESVEKLSETNLSTRVDTFCRAYVIMGRDGEARFAGQRCLDLLRDEAQERQALSEKVDDGSKMRGADESYWHHLDEEERDMMQFAMGILASD